MTKEKECKCIQDMIAQRQQEANMTPPKTSKEDKKK